MLIDYMLVPLAVLTVAVAFITGYDIGRNIRTKQILDYVDRVADCVNRGGNLRAVKATRPESE